MVIQTHMSCGRIPQVDLKKAYDVEHMSTATSSGIQYELWPLDETNPKKAKFPCSLLWTPLPVVLWLAPFIGHVGICREDGVVLPLVLLLDISNLIELWYGYRHTEFGTAITWDDALMASVQSFEHRTYNFFTCNCYSFVANCLNRLCYGGSMEWNMINVAALILFKGTWVDAISTLRSFLPFVVVLCLGVVLVGWPFLIGLCSFSLLLIMWFFMGTFCFKNLLE